MPDAPYLRPFILPTAPSRPNRIGNVDLYLPENGGTAPLVALVHGGPMRTAPTVPPTRWPVYTGYSNLLCGQGAAVAMFNHSLLDGDADTALGDLRIAVDAARHADGVDADWAVLWFFSGGGILSAPYLSAPPAWLRGIACSYATLDAEEPAWDPRAALHSELSVPLLVTRVGQEIPGLVEGQRQFIDNAAGLGIPLRVIDVPHGTHSFDSAEPTKESQDAVLSATQWILATLTQPQP